MLIGHTLNYQYMTDIIKRFKEGQCVFLASNPETKMTISSYQTRTNMQRKKEFTGFVFCTWLFNGDKKENKFLQDALTPCSEKNEITSS